MRTYITLVKHLRSKDTKEGISSPTKPVYTPPMAEEVNEVSEVRRRLAANVARRRTEKGLSQTELGKAIGLPRHSITDIEICRHNVNQDVLDALATFFETSVDVLLGRVVSIESEDDSFTAILKILQTLPQPQKDAVKQVLTLQLKAFGIIKGN